MKAVVFDLGGTLMEYLGMPHNWSDYYRQGFERVNSNFSLNLTDEIIETSIEILKSYNARINYREIEYAPEYIFGEVMRDWNADISAADAISAFFEGMELRAEIYEDTIPCLTRLEEKGIKIAALTDLPTAMPDEMFKKDIDSLLGNLDLYVSSLSCGYRKPNKFGLAFIAERFGMKIEDLLFVGDEEKDRLTAQNAACAFLKIDRARTSDGAIQSLYELEQML